MPTWTVAILEKRYAITYVEAETEAEAEEKAKQSWLHDERSGDWTTEPDGATFILAHKELVKCEADGYYSN